jgi:endonuclease III related protein
MQTSKKALGHLSQRTNRSRPRRRPRTRRIQRNGGRGRTARTIASPGGPPLREVYDQLYRAWGAQHWWPGRTRFEIIVGAILTQSTAWNNVELAIRRLKAARALDVRRLHALGPARLAALVRPAGFFNVKARRLRAFTSLVANGFGGRLDALLRLPAADLRRALLGVHGIGPETADSILLYAAGRPAFVVDAYTRRFLRRHGWMDARSPYDSVAELFTRAIPARVPLYNEFHALIVRLGKTHCRSAPRCGACPLQHLLPRGGPIPP